MRISDWSSDVCSSDLRVSLLIEPTDQISSTTIFDYAKANERSGGLYQYRANPGVLGAIFGSPALGGILDAQIARDKEIQNGNFYGAFDDGIDGGQSDRKQWGITNDTAFTFGNITVRNIFGFRSNKVAQVLNTGATGPLFFPDGTQFSIFHAAESFDRQYLTNELQILGSFDGFDFIVGGFLNNDRSDGPMGSSFRAFAVGPQLAVPVTAHVENKNRAVFGQIGVNLTERLKLNLGGRYSWDRVNACGGGAIGDPPTPATGYFSRADCEDRKSTRLNSSHSCATRMPSSAWKTNRQR